MRCDPGVVAQAKNTSIQEAKASESGIPDQPGLCNKTFSRKKGEGVRVSGCVQAYACLCACGTCSGVQMWLGRYVLEVA